MQNSPGYTGSVNYHQLVRGQKVTESDHNRLELHIKIEAPKIKPIREEYFNFKSVIGQTTFFEATNSSENLRNCFKSKQDFLENAANFENTLKGVFHKSFKKIRGKKRKQDQSEVQDFIQEEVRSTAFYNLERIKKHSHKGSKQLLGNYEKKNTMGRQKLLL